MTIRPEPAAQRVLDLVHTTRAELARTQRMMFALACVSAFQALVVLAVVILVIVRTR